VARNRKRAKERRARRPQPVASAAAERDEPPPPTRHAAPDVELAEAQLALGRPELVAEPPIGDEEQQYEPEKDQFVSDDDQVVADQDRVESDEDEVEDEVAADEEEYEPAEAELEPADGRGRGGRALVRRSTGGGDERAVAHPAKKPGLATRLIHFLQGSWRELQRVQWPDRRQVIQATAVVIGFVFVAGVYLGVADTLASKFVNYILK
jgi:preprotein translocase SecE subunit